MAKVKAKKRPRGRPRTMPDNRHSIHLRLRDEVYAPLLAWSKETGVPQNTLIERAVIAALEKERRTK